MTARPHTQGHTPQQSMQRDAAPDISAASLSFCPVPHRLFTHCGAVADVACSDDRCSTLRWPMQRAAMADAACCDGRCSVLHLAPRYEARGRGGHRPTPPGTKKARIWRNAPPWILAKHYIKNNFPRCPTALPLVLQRDSAAGASVSACATLSAQLGVDRVLLALRDSSYGTLVDTCAACNTIITNYVCHNL